MLFSTFGESVQQEGCKQTVIHRLSGRLGPRGAGKAPPELLGQTFELKDSLVPFGIPPFYELQVWLWKANLSGLFANDNPRVSCPDA